MGSTGSTTGNDKENESFSYSDRPPEPLYNSNEDRNVGGLRAFVNREENLRTLSKPVLQDCDKKDELKKSTQNVKLEKVQKQWEQYQKEFNQIDSVTEKSTPNTASLACNYATSPTGTIPKTKQYDNYSGAISKNTSPSTTKSAPKFEELTSTGTVSRTRDSNNSSRTSEWITSQEILPKSEEKNLHNYNAHDKEPFSLNKLKSVQTYPSGVSKTNNKPYPGVRHNTNNNGQINYTKNYILANAEKSLPEKEKQYNAICNIRQQLEGITIAENRSNLRQIKPENVNQNSNKNIKNEPNNDSDADSQSSESSFKSCNENFSKPSAQQITGNNNNQIGPRFEPKMSQYNGQQFQTQTSFRNGPPRGSLHQSRNSTNSSFNSNNAFKPNNKPNYVGQKQWNGPPNYFNNNQRQNKSQRGSWNGPRRGQRRGSWTGPKRGQFNNAPNRQLNKPNPQNQFTNNDFPGNQMPGEFMEAMWMQFMEQFTNNNKNVNNNNTPNPAKNKNTKRDKRPDSKNENKPGRKLEEPEHHGISALEELLALEEMDGLIPCQEQFTCPICLMDFEPKEGVIIRDCLHSFCPECLSRAVQASEEAEVRCPQIGCEGFLQQKEIQSLIPGELFEKFLLDSFHKIEQQTKGSVHCKEPNCTGWFVVEGNVDQFKCVVCGKVNCIKCETIHAPLSCTEFKDQRQIKDDDAMTGAQINQMIWNREIMNCPSCQTLIEKNKGCDLVTCTSCKELICWATRGPRWGPGGPSDTSGGCRCGVNGIKCSLECNFCH